MENTVFFHDKVSLGGSSESSAKTRVFRGSLLTHPIQDARAKSLQSSKLKASTCSIEVRGVSDPDEYWWVYWWLGVIVIHIDGAADFPQPKKGQDF